MLALTASQVPLVLGIVVALVFLEGLLSADNALVLAVMVRHLPKHEQKRALRYGIIGAFVFRAIAVVLSAQLLHYWHFKVVGGVYLLWLAISHFLSEEEDTEEIVPTPRLVHVGDAAATTFPHGAAENLPTPEGNPPAKRRKRQARFGGGFWGTVVSVELADIAFSIDSIVAAVAMAPQHLGEFWKYGTVYLGGILGIVAMRFVAGYFLILLERFKGLVSGAYYLVAWIGLKLVISGFHNGKFLPAEMPEWLFWGGMVLIVAASLTLRPAGPTAVEDATEHVA